MLKATYLFPVVQRTEQWIDSHRKDTEHGVVWGLADEAPDKHFKTLYAGSAGIALFYLELLQAKEDARYRELALKAGQELLDYTSDLSTLPCAPMGGFAGYAFVFSELAARLEVPEFAAAARQMIEKQYQLAQPVGGGIGWVQDMPYARLTGHTGIREIFDIAEGAAGAGIYFLYAHKQGHHEQALQWSKQAADRLLEVAEPAKGGLRWQMMPDIPWPFDSPNFEHGTAGVAYFFALLYELTGEDQYLDAALKGAAHVTAVTQSMEGGGRLVPHILDDDLPHRFYLGLCHGPVGTNRLFHVLHRITGERQWSTWKEEFELGLLSTGAPEERSEGYWNNVSQCCCDAGVGDYALSQFHCTGNERYLELADRVAREVLRRAVDDGTHCKWPQAEHRTSPEYVQAQTGYMQGAAGVASFLLHLATTLDGSPTKIQFPDSPYGAK